MHNSYWYSTEINFIIKLEEYKETKEHPTSFSHTQNFYKVFDYANMTPHCVNKYSPPAVLILI